MPAEGYMSINKIIVILVTFLLFFTVFFLSCSKEKEEELIVYAYKSFTGQWGAGAKIAELFEQKTGCKVKFVTCKDALDVFNNAIKEENAGDVVIGIDNFSLDKALKADILLSYKPSRLSEIEAFFIMDKDFYLTPFDYGYFAFMYNTESDVAPPSSLKELLDEKYKGKIVIMNPKTSAPGLGALLWIYEVEKEKYIENWMLLTENVLSMPTSWSQGYALFTSGEVPLAISYTTSLAAHVLFDKTDQFQPLIFEEGHLLQLEGMGILKRTNNEKRAKEFIDFMLQDEVQRLLTETQFMFPVIKGVTLPDCFSNIPSPKKILKIENCDIEKVVVNAMEKNRIGDFLFCKERKTDL